MAAFQFPAAPFDLQTVENPITGSTYQWRSEFTKWVLTRQSVGGNSADLLWEGDAPPYPIGDYKLWYSTDTLELYFHFCDANGVCAWVPTSTPITMLEDLDNTVFELGQLLNQVNMAASTNENDIQTIKDNLGQVDLQEVLDNGNVADKGATFGGKVEVDGQVKSKGLSSQGNVTLKISSGETVVMDSGSSYEPMLHLKSYTSTTEFGVEDENDPETFGGRKDVFIVNARGNAELLGNLSLAPGTQNQHAVTYSQLIELEEEIESIFPSLERGQWDIHLTDLTSSDEGKFNLLRPFSQADKKEREDACDAELDQCIRNPNIDQIDCESDHDRCMRRIPAVGTGAYPTDDFANVESLKFSAKDVNGTTHSWANIEAGMLIDVFNQEDDSYMLAEILSVVGSGIVTFNVKVLQYKGKATGRCRIKIYKLDLDAGDLTDFVRKSGDTMTGRLMLQQSDTGNDVLQIKDPNANKMFIVGSDNDNLAKVVVHGSKEFKVGTQQRQIFKIYSDSTCKLGSLRNPTNDTDAVHRKYVDDAISSVAHGDDGLFKPSYWTLDTKMDRDEVTKGKFYWDGSDLYMATSNAAGHTWCPGAQGWRTTNAWVTIYSKDGDLMHTFEVNRINFKEKYGKKYIVEFEDAWHYKTRDLVDGEEYRIVIPGFLT